MAWAPWETEAARKMIGRRSDEGEGAAKSKRVGAKEFEMMASGAFWEEQVRFRREKAGKDGAAKSKLLGSKKLDTVAPWSPLEK